jgi:RNA polymerase sigma-70 factor (ECF subfamily)
MKDCNMPTHLDSSGNDKEDTISIQTQLTSELCHCLDKVAKQRDKGAFTHLFNFFAPKIKRFGMTKFNNEAIANELVQDTMTLVWKKAHLFHVDKGAATTWVYTLMRNTCFDTLRRLKNKDEVILAEDIWPMDEFAAEVTDFKDHLLNKKVLKYVDSLPLAQQSIVKGVYYQELTQEQLAKQLGIPLGTVKSRLRLALAKLKQQMGDKYHD